MRKFSLENVTSQHGKIAIVTGANTGLGYETTKALAQTGCKIIMACRTIKKAETSKTVILKEIPNALIDIISLDLSSLASVHSFTKLFLANYDRLDLLINNAGIMVPPYTKTIDGLESQMAVNYFSHFLLTCLLFPILDKTTGARVIHLSSIAHKKAIINFEDINSEEKYAKMKVYAQSKLACLLFGYELQRRIDQSDSQTMSIIAHPGVSVTNIGQNIPKWLYNIGLPFASLFSHSTQQAALSQLYASLDPNAKGGDYYGPTGFNEMIGKPGKVSSNPNSHNMVDAKKLWEISEKLVGQRFKL